MLPRLFNNSTKTLSPFLLLRPEARFLNKISHLAAALSVTKFISMIGMNVVLVKSDLDVQQTHLCMLNKRSCLAAALSVTKSVTMISMYLVTLCCATEVWLGCSTNPPLYVVMLSCSFKCDQIYNNNSYVFGHTSLCYLSMAWMFNKPTSVELHAFRITCSKRVSLKAWSSSLKAWSSLVGGEKFASFC